jgi:uncharacterized membrane protein YdbT with pleckstrin-like domain
MTEATEQELLSTNPSMSRNSPVGFIVAVALIAAFGLGLIILIVWWLKCKGTTLIITDKRSTLRHGILSKHTTDVLHEHVRNVQVSQGMFQRMFGVGSIGISSSGQSGVEIEVDGVTDPEGIKALIEKHRL